MRALVVVISAAVTLLVGCGMCPPGAAKCDSTVHPMPIQSASYVASPWSAPCPDAGEPPSDGGIRCGYRVEVDADAGTVTESFVLDGQRHVVRYRRTAIESINR